MPSTIHPKAARRAQSLFTCAVQLGIAAAMGSDAEVVEHGAYLIKNLRALLARRDISFDEVMTAAYHAKIAPD